MEFKIIRSPSDGAKEMLKRRGVNKNKSIYDFGAVGLVQGKIIDMIYATDIAEKMSNVYVEELHGSCPQHMIAIAIYGDISAVETAIFKIKQIYKRGV